MKNACFMEQVCCCFFPRKALGQCSGLQKMKVTEIIRILEGVGRNLENT